ncbi:alpha/beta hydrolase [Planococcus sp. YIM B11945]|uniref:alpha/beta hydrolase n=1 Tax=Planococcus sp. YIM B11945 TaxID=3435410 RepID=UPI003D7DDC50
MLTINRGSVQGYKEMDVPFLRLSKEENAKGLAVLLPGAGYTTTAPLFHFATEVFLKRSFDVLEVNYQYKNEAYDDFSMEELSEAVKQDVKTVMDLVLTDSSYETFYVVGKSLGTIAMCTELTRPELKRAKAIWLTPLIHREDVFNAMARSPHTGLSFIGDKDPVYDEFRYTQLEFNPNIDFKLIAGVNHSMEFSDNPVGSIEVLKEIISDIEKF